jgi:Tfp pilus assembly protein PilX
MKRLDPCRRGTVLVLAMMFLAMFAALAAAMAMVAQANFANATTYQQGNQAMAAAETGMRYATYRLGEIADDVTTAHGSIDSTLAGTLWQEVATALVNELGDDAHMAGSLTTVSAEGRIRRITTGAISVGTDAAAPTFTIMFAQHPIDGEDYGSAYYQRDPFNASTDNPFTEDGAAVGSENAVAPWWVRVQVVGRDGGIQRTVNMDYRIDKKVRFAILSRSRVMIGRNVMIEGSIGSRYTYTGYQHGHPVQMRDNFHGLNTTLDGWLDAFTTHLSTHDMDGDNRVRVADAREIADLTGVHFTDANGDGYIDPFDLFCHSYDADDNGSVSQSEFTQDGSLVDAQLWQLINEANYPAGTQFDWNGLRVRLPGDAEWTDAAADLGYLDINDTYAKIDGQVAMKSSVDAWEDGAADGPYQQYYRGPITPDEYEAATTFNADDADVTQFGPENFDVSSYRTMASGSFQSQTASPVANDPSQPTVYTPPGPGTLESVPYNSPYPYDYYARPIYENMTFTDVTIPQGTNALFVNCKFVGVTFVDAETDNSDTNFNYAGMQESNGGLKYVNVDATVDGQTVSDTKALANNIRFDDCTFEGVVVTESPSAYTHARNKLQFTGNTVFDIEAASLSAEQKALFAKSTILAPQFSLDIWDVHRAEQRQRSDAPGRHHRGRRDGHPRAGPHRRVDHHHLRTHAQPGPPG